MEILSTLLTFFLLLGFSAARPYVDHAHSDRTSISTTKCPSKLTKPTLSSTKKKCSSTPSSRKYKSTTTPCTFSKSKAGAYHTKSTTASSKGQYYGDNTSSTALITSTSKAVYPGESTTETTESVPSTSRQTSTSEATSASITSLDGITTAHAPTTSSSETSASELTSASTTSLDSTTTTTSESSTSSAATTSLDSTTTTTSESTTTTTTTSQPTETIFATGPNGEQVAFDVLRDTAISGSTFQIIFINNELSPREEAGIPPESICASRCALRPLCEAWQLNTGEAGRQSCSLKREIGETEDSEGPVVGIRVVDDGTTTTTTASASITSVSTSMSTTTSSATTSESTTTSASSTTSSSTTTTTSSTSTTSTCQPTPTAGSGKRGLAYNYAGVTDLFATTTCPATSGTSKVTWAYNWYSAPQDPKLQEAPRHPNPFVQFVPMLWSAHPDLTSVWLDNVAAAKEQGWTELLAFNEPDLCIDGAGASCMSVPEAVAAYRQWISPLKTQGFRLGGPAVTSSETGKAWLRSFLEQCTGCNIDFIPVHWYGNPSQYGEFFSFLYEMYYGVLNQAYPIWVTEYGLNSGSDAIVQQFMLDSMFEMDTQATFVEKYAWYMAGAPGVFPGNLVQGDALSSFGELYDKQPGRRPS